MNRLFDLMHCYREYRSVFVEFQEVALIAMQLQKAIFWVRDRWREHEARMYGHATLSFSCSLSVLVSLCLLLLYACLNSFAPGCCCISFLFPVSCSIYCRPYFRPYFFVFSEKSYSLHLKVCKKKRRPPQRNGENRRVLRASLAVPLCVRVCSL